MESWNKYEEPSASFPPPRVDFPPRSLVHHGVPRHASIPTQGNVPVLVQVLGSEPRGSTQHVPSSYSVEEEQPRSSYVSGRAIGPGYGGAGATGPTSTSRRHTEQESLGLTPFPKAEKVCLQNPDRSAGAQRQRDRARGTAWQGQAQELVGLQDKAGSVRVVSSGRQQAVAFMQQQQQQVGHCSSATVQRPRTATGVGLGTARPGNELQVRKAPPPSFAANAKASRIYAKAAQQVAEDEEEDRKRKEESQSSAARHGVPARKPDPFAEAFNPGPAIFWTGARRGAAPSPGMAGIVALAAVHVAQGTSATSGRLGLPSTTSKPQSSKSRPSTASAAGRVHGISRLPNAEMYKAPKSKLFGW